jgi:arylsulfatase A-like enzyme
VAQGVKDTKEASYSENLICEEALKFIRDHRHDRFFVYYATQLPHGPVVTPNLRQYRDRDGFPDLRHREWAAMVTHMDESVGKIVHSLEDFGIDDNTVIFFAADNGYSHWGYFARRRWLDDPFFHNKGPWRGGKFTSTEGGVRVPMFVRWPGKIKPGECDHICAFWDFLPTAAELAGLKPPEHVDGVSLVPVLTGQPEKQKQHEYLYWENTHVQAARKGPFRAYRVHPAKPMEIYDILADESSTNNLADERPDLVREFERIFREAHVDSQWYVNPGESPAEIQEKKKRAADTGQIISLVPPNARSER